MLIKILADSLAHHLFRDSGSARAVSSILVHKICAEQRYGFGRHDNFYFWSSPVFTEPAVILMQPSAFELSNIAPANVAALFNYAPPRHSSTVGKSETEPEALAT